MHIYIHILNILFHLVGYFNINKFLKKKYVTSLSLPADYNYKNRFNNCHR